jgi:multiple sugar transport system permease protein
MGWVFIGPALLSFCIFGLYPIIKGLTLSFYSADVFGKEFIGFDNFKEYLTDPLFWKGFKNTLLFTVYTVPLISFIPLALALLVGRASKQVHNFLRFTYYIPELSAGVIIASLWQWIFHPTNGLLNAILGTRIAWLGSNPYAFYTLEIILSSSMYAIPFIVYLSAIISIDDVYYEAAQLDGCGWIRANWYIVLPQVLPMVGFIMIIKTIGILQTWILPFIYTGGGPNYGTTTTVLQMYKNLSFGRWGYASSMGLPILIVGVSLALLQKKLFRDRG